MGIRIKPTLELPNCPSHIREVLNRLVFDFVWIVQKPPTLGDIFSCEFVEGNNYVAVALGELLEKLKIASQENFEDLERHYPYLLNSAISPNYVIFPFDGCEILEELPLASS